MHEDILKGVVRAGLRRPFFLKAQCDAGWGRQYF